MILVSYDKNDEGLIRFVIRQNGVVRAHSPYQFKTMKPAKRLVGEITKVIKKGNGKDERIIKEIMAKNKVT